MSLPLTNSISNTVPLTLENLYPNNLSLEVVEN